MRVPTQKVDLDFIVQHCGSGHSVGPMLVATQQQAPSMTMGTCPASMSAGRPCSVVRQLRFGLRWVGWSGQGRALRIKVA